MTDSNENKVGDKPKLDFSEFHPLMHPVLSRECFGWYGGPWRHLELWWEYQAPHPIAAIKCRLGRHEMGPFWVGTKWGDDLEKLPPTGYSCHYCSAGQSWPPEGSST